MKPTEILEKYYSNSSTVYDILVTHSNLVMRKSLEIASAVPELTPNLPFIKEASMLHDIGIYMTHAPKIDCHGNAHYICHGVLGRELLEAEGLPRHALVCERHVGCGLTIEEIKSQQLPLPKRDMRPISIEEKIICLADKFFSKNPRRLTQEKTLNEIMKNVSKKGVGQINQFRELCSLLKLTREIGKN